MLVSGNVFSKTLEMDTGITLIMPNDFLPEGGYKIAYVLHGISGNNTSWAHYSLLPAYAVHGKTIYVLPEVARSFYSDMTFGFNYFTYVTEELPAICKSLFKITARREDTAVVGNSMGGFGALKCALSKPELYGMCAAFSSPCLFLKEAMEMYRNSGTEADFKEQFGARLYEDFCCLFGPDFACGPETDIQDLVAKTDALAEKPVVYCSCGSRDPFLADNKRFAEVMKKTSFDFTFEECEGDHNFDFFNKSLKNTIDRFAL